MTRNAKIAGGATAAVLAIGGLAGGLTTALAGGGTQNTPVQVNGATVNRQETSACYLEAPPAAARVGPCNPAPTWLHNNPEALDKDNQPLPFTFQSTQWQPIIAANSGPDSQGYFCPATGVADPGDSSNEVYFAGCEPFSLTWQAAGNPAQRLMPDGTIQNLPAKQPDSAAESDRISRSNLQKSSLYAKWAAANPGESQRINAYWNCSSVCVAPSGIVTAYGKAYLAQGEAFHYAFGNHA